MSMKTKHQATHSDRLVSVVTADYVELLVSDILEQAHNFYDRRDFKQRLYQVSILECAYATAGIVLTAINVEGLNNRIKFLLKKRIRRGAQGSWLAQILGAKAPKFPFTDFRDLTDEVFVLRDVIVHNHLYVVKRGYTNDYEPVFQWQTLVKGYGDDKKFKRLVNTRTKTTRLLRLNVQPMKIGFEELIKVLIYFDLYVQVVNRVLGPSFAPRRNAFRFQKTYENNFSHILGHYVAESKNPKFWLEVRRITSHLRTLYAKTIGHEETIAGVQHLRFDDDSVVHNECLRPKCRAFGFRRVGVMGKCYKCGYSLLDTPESPQPS